MKNLLLISNISNKNEQLIEYAARFCAHYKCKLHILHLAQEDTPVLVSSPSYYKGFDVDYENLQSKKITQKITNLTSDFLDREFVQVKIQKGNQEKILRTFIHENFIDMIMLGNTDFDRESDFLEHKNVLMNVLNTPLIVIPEYQIFEPLTRLNFLTTHTKKDLEDIVKLVEIFPLSKIKLTHLTTEENNTVEEQKTEKWVNYVKEKAGKLIKYEQLNEELRQYFNNENYAPIKKYDAFVFTSHKRNFWTRLLDPSTTLGFLSALELPSIIFKIDGKDEN